jgi:hypothetical protein
MIKCYKSFELIGTICTNTLCDICKKELFKNKDCIKVYEAKEDNKINTDTIFLCKECSNRIE